MGKKSSNINIAKIGAPFLWIGLVWVVVISSTVAFVYASPKTGSSVNVGIFSEKSLVTPQSNFETQTIDARAIKINKVFEKFKCPLAGKGEFIVRTADEYKIPFWLVPAVSFQESGCGKKTPKPNGGTESYNAWGYGVWGNNIKTFDSWESGIVAVSKYFGVNFFSKDITDPCEIMQVYTPPSKGSWCEGIKYFADLIENFETE